MPHVEKSVEVAAPVGSCFAAWRNFENFPRFMEHVEEVRMTGADRSHWVVRAGGRDVEFDATTTHVEADRRIAWKASGDVGHSGDVTFEPLDAQRTRVRVAMDYALPSAIREVAAELTQAPERAVEEDLERFKRFMESPAQAP